MLDPLRCIRSPSAPAPPRGPYQAITVELATTIGAVPDEVRLGAGVGVAVVRL